MRTNGATAAIAMVAASVVLLTGCTAERTAPAGGITDTELQAFHESTADTMWKFTGLDDSLRPDVEIETLAPLDWARLVNTCTQQSVMGDPEMQTEIDVAEYACRASHQQSAEGLTLLNTAQLAYLYDYYQDELLPCLGAHGTNIPRVITRADAVDVGAYGGYPWNPYREVVDFTADDPDDVALYAACPPFPADEVFAAYWTP